MVILQSKTELCLFLLLTAGAREKTCHIMIGLPSKRRNNQGNNFHRFLRSDRNVAHSKSCRVRRYCYFLLNKKAWRLMQKKNNRANITSMVILVWFGPGTFVKIFGNKPDTVFFRLRLCLYVTNRNN